ncbi:hypothetical protein [Parafannyhessea umbonata]|uniref:hypothetical protein n=1 Tax=Parafannyhessea umbonata TaxID=604330 RepID=UPI00359C1DC5
MSSRPQPSGNETFDQSKPSNGFGTGNLACPGRRCLFALSLCTSSASSIERHADSCPGVAEATKPSMVSPEMKGALAAALKASSVASRSERCMPATTPREADGPVVLAQVGLLVVLC